MNAWLLTALREKAKAWPYNDTNAKIRRSILDSLGTIKDALTTKDAYVIYGKGDTALHYQSKYADGTKAGDCTLSGFRDDEFEMYVRLGIVGIDMRPANGDMLFDVVVRGPMIAVGDRPVTGTGALDYASLRSRLPLYEAAGCIIHNPQNASDEPER